MATPILAVDDSETMRKVLEITFTGSEFSVVTVAGSDEAMNLLKTENFAAVILDITLEPSGYEVCRKIRAAHPKTPVLLLSSRQNPYDAAQGSASGAHDHMDKPFDTQQLIDRVKVLARDGAVAPKEAAAPAAASAMRSRTLVYGGPPAAAPAPSATATTMPSIQAQNKPAAAAPIAAPIAASPARAPQQPQAAPAPAAAAPPAAPAAAKQAAAVASANGQFAAKAAELGLSPAQVEAVSALSREIVERVVWEVVPVLAETLIKEEIARLTK